MVQFAKIRLTGFKSFVDPTELLIEPGLTGIVGPNGCGKSNILEALRWCMGEASAKQLRGGGMDDVIFGGSRARPSRNIAEVMIQLDNRDRTAAGAFNDHDEIEVVRRIERDSGSNYKVNGKDQRARDVQLLFADLSTGARSTAIVRQGRIEALINAKPTDRRLLLEEAAGITGLHSRRHEAELRLRAAETNLERLEDVVIALEGQMQGLKRQVRQANRYRNLSDHIRRSEATQLHLHWIAALAELDAARKKLKEVEGQVASFTGQAAAASTQLAEAGAALPALRKREAEAAAGLQHAIVARDTLEAERARLNAQRQDCETRVAQIAADMEREQGIRSEAQGALARLADERTSLLQSQDGEQRAQADALAAAEAAAHEVQGLDDKVTAVTQKVAADEAHRAALVRQLSELEDGLLQLREQAEQVASERKSIAARSNDDGAAVDAKRVVSEAAKTLKGAREASEIAEKVKADAEAGEAKARAALRQAEEQLAQLTAEEKGLKAVLLEGDEHSYPPVLDQIAVEPGFEAALGAAFGDDLSAPLDTGAPIHWGKPPAIGEVYALPAGCEPLSSHVDAPSELSRRLDQIGVVEDEAAAAPLLKRLGQGQRLVTRTGAMWRWDGLTVAAGAPTAAATRLEHRNRLEALRREIADVEKTAAAAAGSFESAKTAFDESVRGEKAAGEAVGEAFATLDAARAAETQVAEAAGALRSRLDHLAETGLRLEQETKDTETRLGEAQAANVGTGDSGEEAGVLEALRAALGEKREALAEVRQVHDRLAGEADARRRRLINLEPEHESWTARAANSDRQIKQLDERQADIAAELERLSGLPTEMDARRAELAETISAAEVKRKTAADQLAEAESALSGVDSRLKTAERYLADARETRGRCEGTVAQAEQALAVVTERIRERLRCPPEEALALAELKDSEALPDQETIDRKVERLVRERETMGPVNLRAEQESRELDEQIETYTTERADLVAAIEKFRRAIADLNKEGRQRLLASFETVNTHFKDLFVRLYGGGRAHLELEEADDPLDAGLEIMASPPGKRLQRLSLLSGGEKALTALALLFAVFLTNPAPICVLDEVDAPLDDSNVDRFCSLVQDIADETKTRFLVVTHHRMTMARTDRLYGVTMAEHGVSQLVSVDLQEAEALRETA